MEVGGSSAMGQMPTIVENIMGGWPEGVLEGWGRHPDKIVEEEEEMERSGPRANGVLTNGVHVNGAYAGNDNESWGWEGGAAKDREKLFSLLDECLAVGQ